MGDRVNLGELRQRGVMLFTREAAAVLHEVCDRMTQAEEEGLALAPPTLDKLWVTSAGELVMSSEPADSTDDGRSMMQGLALLIEALLPPTIRNQADYAVPGSFRVLAPRARGFPPGLPPIRTPAELGAAVGRYRSGDTTLVLQHLFSRTAAAPLAPAAAAAIGPPTQLEPEHQTPLDSTVGPSEQPFVEPPTTNGDGDLDLPLNKPEPEPEAWVRPLPPSSASGTSRSGRWMWLLAGAAVLIAFGASYEVTRRFFSPSEMTARSEITARADEPRSAESQQSATPLAIPSASAIPSPSATSGRTSERTSERTPEGPSAAPVLAEPATRTPAPKPVAPPSPVETPARRPVAPPNPVETPAPRPDAPPRPLETPASAGPVFSPSFAGSGSALVFHAGRDPVARLMSAEMRESSSPLEVFTIVGDTARNYHPRLSPDGRLLAFDSDRDGERGVYVANRDGSNVRRVSGPGFAAVPSWSPDMRSLAFVRAELDRPQVWNLWLFDWATGALTRLTRHRYGQTWGASWFPDSRQVCYSHEDRLLVLDTHDGSTRVFTSPRRGRLVRTPAVSPDGRLVAFQVLRDGVWLLDLDSGVMRRLIDDPSAEEFAWDPNGGRLAYHSRRSGEWRIWIAAAPRSVD